MEDIVDIYEPVYQSNYIVYIIISILILTTALITFLILQHRRSNKKERPEEIYSKAMDKLLLLKGESEKIEDSIFLKRSKKILLEYINYLESDDLGSLTSDLIAKRLNKDGFNELGNIYRTYFDPVSYGKAKLTPEIKKIVIKGTGDYISYLFREIKVD